MNAEDYIKKYDMKSIYEGGWCSVLHRSPFWIKEESSQEISADIESVSSIFYLLKNNEISKWHRLLSQETWFHIDGGTVELSLGGSDDKPTEEKKILLGKGHELHALVSSNTWQSARIKEGEFALIACVVSPAYRDEDIFFEEGRLSELL